MPSVFNSIKEKHVGKGTYINRECLLEVFLWIVGFSFYFTGTGRSD
jgi:hypothetical protein